MMMLLAGIFGYLIFFISIVGVGINSVSLAILLCRIPRRPPSMFHDLLKVLAIYDIVVVVCCGCAYGLPDIWPGYRELHQPYLSQYILPLTHISVMSSVYCTVLISFERYVRICFFCQLRSSTLITTKNFKFYLIAIIVGPVIFYVPKFFEIRAETTTKVYYSQVNCSRALVLTRMESEMVSVIKGRLSPLEQDYVDAIIKACANVTWPQLQQQQQGLPPKPRAAARDDSLASEGSMDTLPLGRPTSDSRWVLPQRNLMRNMTRYKSVLRVAPTQLRSNPIYYKIYYVYLNTIFASIIPLIMLMYLNISTVRALKQMIQQDGTTADDITTMTRRMRSGNNNSIQGHASSFDHQYKGEDNEVPVAKPLDTDTIATPSTSLPQGISSSIRDQRKKIIHGTGYLEAPSAAAGGAAKESLEGLSEEDSTKRREALAKELFGSDESLKSRDEPMGDIESAVTVHKETPIDLEGGRKSYQNSVQSRSIEGMLLRRQRHLMQKRERRLSFFKAPSEPPSGHSELPFSSGRLHQAHNHLQCRSGRRDTIDTIVSYESVGLSKVAEEERVNGMDKDLQTTNEDSILPEAAGLLARTDQNVNQDIEPKSGLATQIQDDCASQKSSGEPLPVPPTPESVTSSSGGGAKVLNASQGSSVKGSQWNSLSVPANEIGSSCKVANSARTEVHRSAASIVISSPRDKDMVCWSSRHLFGLWNKAQKSSISIAFRPPRPLKSTGEPPAARSPKPNEDPGSSDGAATKDSGCYQNVCPKAYCNSIAMKTMQPDGEQHQARERQSSGVSHSLDHFKSSFRGLALWRSRSLSMSLSSRPTQPPIHHHHHHHLRSSAISEGEKNQERRLTRISIFIVWLFLGCHAWKLVPTAFEAYYSNDGLSHRNWPEWVIIAEHVSHLLICLNSAINFLIYAMM